MNIENTLTNTVALADYYTELSFRDIALSTVQKYKQCIRDFLNWLMGDPLSAQAAKMFLAHLRDAGYKPASIQLYYQAIKPLLEFNGIPLKIKIKRPRHLPAYHSAADISSLLSAVLERHDNWAFLKKRDALIILTLAFTGLRSSELLRLRPCDISSDFIFVRHGKGDKDRTIPLANDLNQPLYDYIKSNPIRPTDPIFPIKRSQLHRIIKTYATKAGINDLSPHSLRHYFATTLVERQAPLKAVQELLGHADISTTATYLDLIPAHLQGSIALLNGSLSLSVNNKDIPMGNKDRSKSLSLSLSNEGRGGPTCPGSKSKKEKRSTPSSTLPRSKPSPNTGPAPGANLALPRVALTAVRLSPRETATRPDSFLITRTMTGSLESKQ